MSFTRSASIMRLMTKALPVCRWQFRQWQQWTKSGSDVSRKRTVPQAHPPSQPLIAVTAALRPAAPERDRVGEVGDAAVRDRAYVETLAL